MRINLSRNELKALLIRTFEALYGHTRDYHDMAHTVLWLEGCGHDGVASLVEALPYLEQEGLAKPSLIKKQDGHFIMDCEGHSLFCLASSICDLTTALLSETQAAACVGVINTQNSQALMGVLRVAARQGFAAMTMYEGYAARIEAGADYPIIYQNQNISGLSFMCARRATTLDEYTKNFGRIIVDENIQTQAYTASLNDGINIARSDYDALKTVANRVLVEATEASRKGAGE